MANQNALQDNNQVFSLIVASGTSDTAETRRVLSDSFGGILTGSSLRTVRIDESTAGTTYIGFAPAGSNEGSAVWIIQKIIETTGTTQFLWANGATNGTNIWSARGTMSFS